MLKFQGWQMVHKVRNILDITQKNSDSKILTFQGVFFCPCLYRHGKRIVCGLQMRWSDYYLITETGIDSNGLLHICITVQENLFIWGMTPNNWKYKFLMLEYD